MPPVPDTTQLLRAVREGDEAASDLLVAHLYEDLRAIARQRLRQLRPGETLNTTGLVHEAWIRLAHGGQLGPANTPSTEGAVDPSDGPDAASPPLNGRDHFLALASRAMRFVLVDHARAQAAEKRGGGRAAITMERVQVAAEGHAPGLLEVNQALEALAVHSSRLAGVVELRFFGGLSHEEVAQVTGYSVPTVKRDWARARAWLLRTMEDARDGREAPGDSEGGGSP
jgi:DNA-directed RNA polymerase specialized sigma24 family protein